MRVRVVALDLVIGVEMHIKSVGIEQAYATWDLGLRPHGRRRSMRSGVALRWRGPLRRSFPGNAVRLRVPGPNVD